MKKILITISIIITSIFFVGNVMAYDKVDFFEKIKTPLLLSEINKYFKDITNNNNITNTTLLNARNMAKEYINNYSDVDKYFIAGTINDLYIGFYNSNDNAVLNFQLLSSGNFYSFVYHTNTSIRYSARVINDSLNFVSEKNRFVGKQYVFYYSNKVEYLGSSNFYFEGDIPIVYDEHTNLDFSPLNFDKQYYNISIDDGEICINLKDNDLFYSNGKYNFNKKEPSFGTMLLENVYSGDDIYAINVKLSVNNYNRDNYLYEYQKSTDSEWKDLNDLYVSSKNSFNKLFFENGSYYFRILDKENKIVSTANLTLSNINETSSYLTFDLETPDFCKINMENKEYITCKYLNIYAHNFVEHSNVGYYSYDSEIWTIFYSDTNLVVSDNTTMYFKVVDINNNSKIKSTYTYTITGIDDNLPDIGNYGIEFISNLSKNKTYTDLSIIFYNVNKNQRKYYYSTDFKNWNDISELLVENNKYSEKYILRLFENGTIAAKVEDYNGNVLKYSTITITSITYSPESLLDYVSDFVDSLKDYSDFFNRSFDLFFNGLPEMVRLFMVVVWIIFLYFFIMQLGGWK